MTTNADALHWYAARLRDDHDVEGLARINPDGSITLQPYDAEARTLTRQEIQWLEPIW